jgi:undecaprenyl phosphate N,N'-diacetylbacillosamine 1-phosphate transferase
MTNKFFYKKYFKRICDLVISIILIGIFFPIFLIIGIVLFIDSGLPILFFQLRPGLNSKLFTIIKFRTMNFNKTKPHSSKIQKLLRLTSLDEIPQFFNVLNGDMSLIGPRPLITEYLSFYSKRQSKRQNIKPGITGLAQINGRNSSSWNKKFAYDLWYVKNVSFLIDLKIILYTVIAIFNFKNSDFRKNKNIKFKKK